MEHGVSFISYSSRRMVMDYLIRMGQVDNGNMSSVLCANPEEYSYLLKKYAGHIVCKTIILWHTYD